MSFMDRLKGKTDQLREQHGDKIAQGLDKAGDAARRATKGKYDQHIDRGLGEAKKRLDKPDDRPR
jgi:hypothetical protein